MRVVSSRVTLLWLSCVCLGICATLPAYVNASFGERTYEMVSPPYKAGYNALAVEAVSPSGNAVAFYSSGGFSGSPSGGGFLAYLARRTPSGWSTTPLLPPAAIMPDEIDHDASSTLETVVRVGKRGSDNEEGAFQFGSEEIFLWHETMLADVPENWEIDKVILTGSREGANPFVVGGYDGANADLCHILINGASQALTSEASVVSLAAQGGVVYDVTRGCGTEAPSIHAVAANNVGGMVSTQCTSEVNLVFYAQEDEARHSGFNAITAGGKEIFFTTNVEASPRCSGGGAGAHQLFVRLSDTRTLEVSKPLGAACGTELPCPGAEGRPSADFIGASENGSRVFYTSGDLATGGGRLYTAAIGCPSGRGEECLSTEISQTHITENNEIPHTTTEPPEVQGVVRISPNGERVYFVARGFLSSRPNMESDIAVKGADNLYVYDTSTDEIKFVTQLCSGTEMSGIVQNAHCPFGADDSALWTAGEGGEAQTAGGDGRFLVFASYGQLSKDDTDAARDIYRYDAQENTLYRASTGEDGFSENGNLEVSAQIMEGHWGKGVTKQFEMNNRAVSEDGSRIVFTSAEPLSPRATNGLENIYEWHSTPGDPSGEVSLVSSGTGQEGVQRPVISLDGRNIFFDTTQSLVPQDVDVFGDVYDARIGGGFPVSPAVSEQCSGDACQETMSSPAPVLIPGTATQPAGEDYPSVTPPAKHIVVKHKKHAKNKRKKARSHKATVKKKPTHGRTRNRHTEKRR